MSRWPAPLLLASGVALAAHAAHALLGLAGPGADTLFVTWVYDGLS